MREASIKDRSLKIHVPHLRWGKRLRLTLVIARLPVGFVGDLVSRCDAAPARIACSFVVCIRTFN